MPLERDFTYGRLNSKYVQRANTTAERQTANVHLAELNTELNELKEVQKPGVTQGAREAHAEMHDPPYLFAKKAETAVARRERILKSHGESSNLPELEAALDRSGASEYAKAFARQYVDKFAKLDRSSIPTVLEEVAGKSDHWVESQLPGRLRRALDPGHPAPGATYDALKNSIRGTVLRESDALTPGGGPLGLKNSATFSGGRYATIQLDQPLTVYRAWTPGQSREFGQFWALEKPIGSLQTRIDSALLPEWGKIEDSPFYEQATHWVSIRIPVGSVIHIGEVGSQGGAWLGAKSQLLIKGGPQDAWRTGQGLLQQ